MDQTDPIAVSGPPLRRIADLPGPPGLPVFGNLLQIDRPRMHLQLENWARQYGDIYRFRLGGRQFVAVADPEVIASVLRDRPDGFRRTSRLERTSREMGFGGLFSSNGDDWRRQRSMVLGGLDPTHVRSFFPTLIKVTERMADRWQSAARLGQAFDLQSDLMRYTVDVTAGLAFGKDINTIESREQTIQSHLDKILPSLFRRLMTPFAYWRFFRLPSDRRLDHHLDALRIAVNGFISDSRALLQQHPEWRLNPRNLIEAMVAARDQPGSGLSDGDVSGNVLTMLLAGEDTTANTLAWLIWLMWQHPEAWQRAVNEVTPFSTARRCLSDPAQLGCLPYLDACISEAMRLRPVAPLNNQEAAQDCVVGGVAIPRGTWVMLLMRPATLRDDFFPDPHRFLPERWLGAGQTLAGLSSPKRVAMPFGAGPRICPGRYLALAEIKMLMATVLTCFEVAEITTPDGQAVQERIAMTMAPAGLKVRLKLRDRAPSVPTGS